MIDIIRVNRGNPDSRYLLFKKRVTLRQDVIDLYKYLKQMTLYNLVTLFNILQLF